MKSMWIGMIVAALAVGCSKGEGDASKPAGDKAAAGKAAPAEKKAPATKAAPKPAAKAWLKIEQYGVQIEAPAGAKANKGAGTSLMIQSDSQCTIMLSKKNDMAYFPSYESAKKTIEKGVTGKMKELLVDEMKDADNWTLFYSKAGMIDPNKTQYGLDMRMKVGDGIYSCGRVTNTKADTECVMAACKSLKPL